VAKIPIEVRNSSCFRSCSIELGTTILLRKLNILCSIFLLTGAI
jgi:hypothetical protein